VLVGVALPATPVGTLLGFVALPAAYFGFVVAAVLGYLLAVQLVKARLVAWR
jgi:Mg2+-importing ATPase